MKQIIAKTISLSLALVIAQSASALAHDEENDKRRAFGGPVVQQTTIAGESEWLVGGYGGYMVADHLALGLAGFGLASGLEAQGLPQTTDGTDFSYGGVFVAAPVETLAFVSVVPSLLVGAGELAYSDKDGIESKDELFILEPTLTLQVQTASFMRIDLGAGYRMVRGVNIDGLDNDAMSDLSVRASMAFGSF